MNPRWRTVSPILFTLWFLVVASKLEHFTVCGHSSGGSMASQHAIAFSDRVLGLGHMEAAPYGCSQVETILKGYNKVCTTPAAAEEYLAYAKQSEADGKIAHLSGMRGLPVWITAGERDTIVHPSVVQSARIFYAALGTNVTDVIVVKNAEHAFVVDRFCDQCNPCTVLAAPYINNCFYDAAGAMLKHLYGNKLAERRVRAELRNIIQIDQKKYFPKGMSGKDLGMSSEAYAYVPQKCKMERCPLHIVYHGCESSADVLGPAIVENSGFNEWAQSSGLLVLYPQSRGSSCWDWEGIETPTFNVIFDTRKSPQMNTVNRMADDLRSIVNCV